MEEDENEQHFSVLRGEQTIEFEISQTCSKSGLTNINYQLLENDQSVPDWLLYESNNAKFIINSTNIDIVSNKEYIFSLKAFYGGKEITKIIKITVEE